MAGDVFDDIPRETRNQGEGSHTTRLDGAIQIGGIINAQAQHVSDSRKIDQTIAGKLREGSFCS